MTHHEKLKMIQELKAKIEKVTKEKDYYQSLQLAYKLILNGTYGCFCHPAFTVSNTDIANSITSLAREVINYMLDNIEDYFYNKWYLDKDAHNILGSMYISKVDDQYFLHRPDGKIIDKPKKDDPEYNAVQKFMEAYNLVQNDFVESDKKEFQLDGKTYPIIHKIFIHDFSNVKPLSTKYSIEPNPTSKAFDAKRGVREVPIIIYGDTDSISPESTIRTDNGIFTIEDLYNKNISSGSAGNTIKGHESVNCKEKVLNWDDGLYYAPVKRIIRHKVTKPKWKLKTKSGKEIIVTNDHSMIVFRDGKKLEIKPSQILKTDKILVILEKN